MRQEDGSCPFRYCAPPMQPRIPSITADHGTDSETFDEDDQDGHDRLSEIHIILT